MRQVYLLDKDYTITNLDEIVDKVFDLGNVCKRDNFYIIQFAGTKEQGDQFEELIESKTTQYTPNITEENLKNLLNSKEPVFNEYKSYHGVELQFNVV